MKSLGIFAAVIAVVLVAATSSRAYQYKHSVTAGVQTVNLNNNSGEVQSTIVPPGVNFNCPAGRFLISMDTMKPPQLGTVIGRDLNNPNAQNIQSTFSPTHLLERMCGARMITISSPIGMAGCCLFGAFNF
jgi:hypothetical protein